MSLKSELSISWWAERRLYRKRHLRTLYLYLFRKKLERDMQKCHICGKPAVAAVSGNKTFSKSYGFCYEHAGEVPGQTSVDGDLMRENIRKIQECAKKDGVPVRFGGEVPPLD